MIMSVDISFANFPTGMSLGLHRPEGSGVADRKESLVEVAYRELERRFIMLELAPGSIWKVGDLAALMGVGRTPMREAVQRMASDQLVTVLKRAGILISPISIQDQLIIVDTRRALELVVSVRAARLALPTERHYLTELADAIETAGLKDDVLAYLAAHFELKHAVAQFARNPFATRALQPLHTFSQRFYFNYHKQFHNLKEVGEAHALLGRAVASGDVHETERCSTLVSDIAEQLVRDVLRKTPEVS